jgi:acylphosphatase
MPAKRLSLTVHGRVQGVGFRFFAQEAAEALGVVGWVRNGWDRSVEIEAQADEVTLDSFCDRLREGPTLSRVTDLENREIPVQGGESSFEVRF